MQALGVSIMKNWVVAYQVQSFEDGSLKVVKTITSRFFRVKAMSSFKRGRNP